MQFIFTDLLQHLNWFINEEFYVIYWFLLGINLTIRHEYFTLFGIELVLKMNVIGNFSAMIAIQISFTKLNVGEGLYWIKPSQLTWHTHQWQALLTFPILQVTSLTHKETFRFDPLYWQYKVFYFNTSYPPFFLLNQRYFVVAFVLLCNMCI